MSILIGALKVIVGFTITRVACSRAEERFHTLVVSQIVYNMIMLCVFIIAMLIAHFDFFGEKSSSFISTSLMLGMLITSTVRITIKLPFIFAYILPFPIHLIRGYSIGEIISKYVAKTHPAMDLLLGMFVTYEELLDEIWGYLGKQILVFCMTMGFYIGLFNFIVKPMLQVSVLGIKGVKMYLLPFIMAIDYARNLI